MTAKKSQLKIFLTGILITVTAVHLTAQNDYDDISFKGPIKTVVTVKSYATDSMVFNRNGKVTEVWSLTDDTWNIAVTIGYDVNQNKIELKLFYDSEVSSYYKFTYDAKNNLVEGNYFSWDNSLLSFVSYSYGEAGNVVLEEYKNADGTVYENVTYSYNAEGLCSERTDIYGSVASVYDAVGRVIQEKNVLIDMYAKKPIVTSATYSYDSAGQRSGWISRDEKGKVLVTATSTYDEMGNYTGGTWVSKDENLSFTYSYEYDEKGNWTTYDGATLERRRFTYY